MLSHRRNIILTLVLFSNFCKPSLTQNLSTPQGCAAIGCETTQCTVAGTTFTYIGITSYDEPSIGTLTWTLGTTQFSDVDIPDNNVSANLDSYIQHSLFLGTDPSTNLNAIDGRTGCAFIFIDPTNNGTLFYDSTDEPSAECVRPGIAQALAPTCPAMLTSQASLLAQRDNATCTSIASALSASIPADCGFINSARVAGVQITGSSAPHQITAAENSTADCWPTLPQSNDLTLVYEFNVSTSLWMDAFWPILLGGNPVMTLFYNDDGDVESGAGLLCPQIVRPPVSTEGAVASDGPLMRVGWVFGVVVAAVIYVAFE